MSFLAPDVQEQFRLAGWAPGRNVRAHFDALPGFQHYPEDAKRFLYACGGLEVQCLDPLKNDLNGRLDLGALIKGYFDVEHYLRRPRAFGGGTLMTFPLGYYDLDNAVVQCDVEGNLYIAGDTASWMATDLLKGIERIIREDYDGTVHWDEEALCWTDRTPHYDGIGLVRPA